MKLKVAYIVPIYNVNDYLRECLDSLKKIKTNKEIILVDDCGQQDPMPIINDFIGDSSFKYVRNPKNLGLGEARNSGVEAASKDVTHVYFLDSDDFINYKNVDNAFDTLLGENVSLIRQSLWVFDKKKTWESREMGARHNKIVPFGSTGSFWQIDVVKNVKFWMKNFEDAPWTLKVINESKVKGWVFEPLYKPTYYYRIRLSSISNSNMTVEKVENFKTLRNYLKENGSNSPDRLQGLWRRYFQLSKIDRKNLSLPSIDVFRKLIAFIQAKINLIKPKKSEKRYFK